MEKEAQYPSCACKVYHQLLPLWSSDREVKSYISICIFRITLVCVSMYHVNICVCIKAVYICHLHTLSIITKYSIDRNSSLWTWYIIKQKLDKSIRQTSYSWFVLFFFLHTSLPSNCNLYHVFSNQTFVSYPQKKV